MCLNTKKAICECGKKARIWDGTGWFCSVSTNFGEFNLTGFCKTKKKEEKNVDR